MVSGKAISRAVRVHLLLDAVFNGLLLSKSMDVGEDGASWRC